MGELERLFPTEVARDGTTYSVYISTASYRSLSCPALYTAVHAISVVLVLHFELAVN